MQFFQIPEGFQNQDVYARFEQGGDLFAEGVFRLLKGCLSERFNPDAQRTYRACHPAVKTLRCLLGQPGPCKVDFMNLPAQAVALKPETVAAKVLVSTISAPACRYS